MTYLSHNDEPALTDSFERHKFVEKVRLAIEKCQPPKSITVSGYWVSGRRAH